MLKQPMNKHFIYNPPIRDKYTSNPPGGYTIFHFKVPKKNQNCTAPQLTAVKKRYQQNGEDGKGNKTEKVRIIITILY